MLRTALVANALLQWADAATTLFVLGAGAAEGNPVMAAWIESAGIGGFLILKLLIALALVALVPAMARLQRRQRKHALQVSAAFALLMALVVANNLAVLVATRG